MNRDDIVFTGSFTKLSQCPEGTMPEYAFIGRSNVGKSSLINMLTERKNLAHISGTPGKTQTLNYFKVNDAWYLVDLPGYGYARASKKLREQWQKTLEWYLTRRENLACVFLLIDANITPQRSDLEFTGFLGKHQVPFCLVYTKTDRSNQREIQHNIDLFRQAMLQNWENLPQQFLSSSVRKTGREEILAYISKINEQISGS